MAYYPRIRDLREDSDKTQAEVAEYIGTHPQYYGSYEKGANEISFERAIMLAKYYNVSLDYIAGLTNTKSPIDAPRLSKEQIELIKVMDSLSSKNKKKFIQLLKQLVNAME